MLLDRITCMMVLLQKRGDLSTEDYCEKQEHTNYSTSSLSRTHKRTPMDHRWRVRVYTQNPRVDEFIEFGDVKHFCPKRELYFERGVSVSSWGGDDISHQEYTKNIRRVSFSSTLPKITICMDSFVSMLAKVTNTQGDHIDLHRKKKKIRVRGRQSAFKTIIHKAATYHHPTTEDRKHHVVQNDSRRQHQSVLVQKQHITNLLYRDFRQ